MSGADVGPWCPSTYDVGAVAVARKSYRCRQGVEPSRCRQSVGLIAAVGAFLADVIYPQVAGAAKDGGDGCLGALEDAALMPVPKRGTPRSRKLQVGGLAGQLKCNGICLLKKL